MIDGDNNVIASFLLQQLTVDFRPDKGRVGRDNRIPVSVEITYNRVAERVIVIVVGTDYDVCTERGNGFNGMFCQGHSLPGDQSLFPSHP